MKFSWKVGDKVRPKGMPNYYIITENINNETWKMVIDNNRYFDIIPKSVENTDTWEKIITSS